MQIWIGDSLLKAGVTLEKLCVVVEIWVPEPAGLGSHASPA